MAKRQHILAAVLLGSSHFVIDFSCTALLTAAAKQSFGANAFLFAIVYNGLAFAFQLPIGALADRLGKNRLFAIVGCLTVALGAFFLKHPILLCVFLGLGNALFHVGGGREALLRGGKQAAFVGHFVAPGAIGIFLGPLLPSVDLPLSLFLSALLLLFSLLLLLFRQQDSHIEALYLPSEKQSKKRILLTLICMFLTVLLRAYMGSSLHDPFQSRFLFAFLFVLSVFAGKFFGGSLADRFGAFPFSLAAQLAASVLFVLSLWFPCCAYPAVFLFNTTMAITAHRLYRLLPAYGGTMFGLTTFALFLGTLPRLLGLEAPFFSWWGLLLLSLSSAALLLTGLYSERGGKDD